MVTSKLSQNLDMGSYREDEGSVKISRPLQMPLKTSSQSPSAQLLTLSNLFYLLPAIIPFRGLCCHGVEVGSGQSALCVYSLELNQQHFVWIKRA